MWMTPQVTDQGATMLEEMCGIWHVATQKTVQMGKAGECSGLSLDGRTMPPVSVNFFHIAFFSLACGAFLQLELF